MDLSVRYPKHQTNIIFISDLQGPLLSCEQQFLHHAPGISRDDLCAFHCSYGIHILQDIFGSILQKNPVL